MTPSKRLKLNPLGVNGGIIDTNANDVTLANAITGAGGLTKTGAGTLTLSGDNIYAGQTAISAGTLQLGSGGTTGILTGDVVDNGELALNRSDTLAVGGAISGTGSGGQNGSGTAVLTGANTYTGATFVNAGTLQAGGDNALGQTVNLAVASGATFNSGNGFSQSIGALNTVAGANVTFAPGSTVTIMDTLRPAGDTNGGTVAGNTLFGSGTLIVDPSVLAMPGSQPGFVGTLGIVAGSQLLLGVAGDANPADIVFGGTLQNAGTVSFATTAVGNTFTMNSLIGQGGTFVTGDYNQGLGNNRGHSFAGKVGLKYEF